ncbi:diatom-specific cyclin [Seminavis robusta]|uniref:Diatom-specific cyclin n=1 Tax=Seminavis robusta TaxID=568900 RepID=A0A9N8HG67_9STRA|nr:diatom-specific cyclin [Seminavis robusta]|eukprot:Sro560_g166640.1 diatom-specific cyclin (319) ;mRNA; r:13960-14916
MSCQQEINMNYSTLEAMRRQECTGYKCEDYLHSKLQKSFSPTSAIDAMFMTNFADQQGSTMTQEDIMVCINNRSKMAQWCMTLMDACQLSRETVTIAMSYLDRFLATPTGSECIEDSAAFQLACMTALYSAIKIHEEKAISPEVLSTISRGFYSKQDMEAMEWRMLQALQWRVNVPTPLAFVREYLQMIPSAVLTDACKDQLLTLVKIQTELAVANYSFVTIKPSSIGFAALMNALEVVGLDFGILHQFILAVSDLDTDEIFRIQATLFAAVSTMTSLRGVCGQEARRVISDNATSRPKRRQSHTISPRAVTDHAQIA